MTKAIDGTSTNTSGGAPEETPRDAAAVQRGPGRPKSNPSSARASVQSLDRALHLLDIIADADGLALAEIAKKADLAPSTVHRILGTLENHGHVRADPDTGRWLIGVAAFRVGSAFLRSRNLVAMSRVGMRQLMEATGETVNLGIEDDGDVVFVAQIESHAPIRAFFRPGRRTAIHASGIGKALLATMPEERVAEIFAIKNPAAYSRKTITGRKAMLAELAKIRARGWALDDEEQTLGMRCVAAPIFNEYGETIAAISISGPTVRMADDRLAELNAAVAGAARRITEENGGYPPANWVR
jgi:IclR family acetate operon transcriptional repressor